MLEKTRHRFSRLGNDKGDTVNNKSNVVVNMINIADVIDSSNMEIASSCVAIIGIEPFVLENFTVEGMRRDIRITKDPDGNIYINDMRAEFVEIGEGLKVLIIQSEEEEVK